jgi:hypothetical protein
MTLDSVCDALVEAENELNMVSYPQTAPHTLPAQEILGLLPSMVKKTSKGY